MYGSCAELSGCPPEVWNAVSGWKQQSVFSLHWVVRMPSQSISMSAVQNTAPFLSQTGMVRLFSESVLYLPLEICWQLVTLASSSAAVGAPPPPPLPSVTARESTFGPPFAVVAVARTVCEPADRLAETVTVLHESQEPVPGKPGVDTGPPSTATA